MIEAVLFDLDGTLIDFVEADIKSLQWLYTLSGTNASFDNFLETAVDEIMKFHELVARHEISPLDMHRFRLENTFRKYDLVWKRDYLDLYRKKLLEFSLPFNGVEKLLMDVRKKVKTGLITNAYDGKEQRERIQIAGLEKYFDVIVIAGEVGFYKPEPAIFLSALNRLNVSSNNALYIGDSVTYDILGAKAVGMKTVLFKQKEKRAVVDADYCICGMDELQNLLEKILLTSVKS